MVGTNLARGGLLASSVNGHNVGRLDTERPSIQGNVW
jgi:hypothetical protein